MTTDTDRIEEARKALRCLYIAVDKSIADDIGQRVEAAFVSLSAELTGLRKENDTLRGLLGNSAKDCQYCGLPAAEQGRCKLGFPGCSRSDDQQLGKYFAAGYALDAASETIERLKRELALKDADLLLERDRAERADGELCKAFVELDDARMKVKML